MCDTPALRRAPCGARVGLCTWGRRESRAGRARDSSRVPQPFQGRELAPPLGQHLRVQLEEHARPEQRFDLPAGRLPDRLDGAAPFPDHDSLLAGALDIDHGSNIHRLLTFSELVDLDGHAVGQLFVQQLERRLAHEFGGEEAHRLRRHRVGIVMKRALGEVCAERLEQTIEAVATDRRYEGGRGWWRAVEVGARSDFVYTVTIDARGARSSFATSVSGGAGKSDSGCKYAMTSASAIARSAAARIVSCSLYSGSSSPGESVKMNCVSSRVSRPTTGRRVDCGLGETIARCSPIRAFRSVDLPTLGFPARATTPQRVMAPRR